MAGQRIMRGLTAAFLAIVLGLTIGGMADLLISASAGDEAGRQAGGLGFIAGVVAAIWFTFKVWRLPPRKSAQPSVPPEQWGAQVADRKRDQE